MTKDALLPLPKDDGRDFRVGALITMPDVLLDRFEINIPKEYRFTQNDDTCAKEATTTLASYLNKTKLEGLLTWVLARTREKMNPEDWGIDLRSMLMAWAKFGGLKYEDSPFHNDTPRNIYADITNWDLKMLMPKMLEPRMFGLITIVLMQ